MASNELCQFSYIGQTGQNLKQRIYQHKLAIKNSKVENSALAEHAINNNHYNIDWDNPGILAQESNPTKRIFKEAVCITREAHPMNRKEEVQFLPKTYLAVL